METTYLDNEIILLYGYREDGTISDCQNRKLAEYKQIKQLLLHAVNQRSEMFCKCTTDTDIYQSEGFIKCQTCYKKIKMQNCG